MNVTYRAAVASATPASATPASATPASEPQLPVVEEPRPRLLKAGKVARLSCCCKISQLMPLVRQLHDEARVRYEAARQSEQRQQAA